MGYWHSAPDRENHRLESFFRDLPPSCTGNIGSPCAVPENGTGTREDERGRDDDEERNICEGSCLRHGRRNDYRRWTNRVQRADVLLLRRQVQREVRS